MPLLKASGVKTLFVEFPDHIVSDLVRITSESSLLSYVDSNNLEPSRMTVLWHTLQAAKTMGITVRGYECPEYVHRVGEVKTIMDDPSLRGREKKERIDALSEELVSLEWTQRRDDYAAAFVRREARGKYLVLGGLAHSGNYDKGDMPTERPGVVLAEAVNADMKPYARKGYKGLNNKLGIPAIDFELTSELREIGSTIKGDGKSADFHARFPASIYQDPKFPWLPRSSPRASR